MENRYFIIGIALVLLLAGAVGSAEANTKHHTKAKSQHVRCTFSATFAGGVETNIDTNGDGVSALWHQGLENCNIGRFFFQEEAEFKAPLPAPVTCPAGTQEFHLQQAHDVDTEEKTSDQFFLEVATDAGTLCFNPSDLTFSFTTHGTINGGTGSLTGATGTFDAHSTGKFLVTGAKAGVFGDFGQFSGTTTGTLILPKGENEDEDED